MGLWMRWTVEKRAREVIDAGCAIKTYQQSVVEKALGTDMTRLQVAGDIHLENPNRAGAWKWA